MATAKNMETSSGIWQISFDKAATATLSTASTYLDRNIQITVNPAAGTAGAVSVGENVNRLDGSNVEFGTDNNDNGIVVTSAAASYTVTPGWITTPGSSLPSESKYIKGVTLNAPSSGTRSFYVTVPNGASGTTTFTFKVDDARNVWVE